MTDRLSGGTPSAASSAITTPFASIAPYGRAGDPGCRGVCPDEQPGRHHLLPGGREGRPGLEQQRCPDGRRRVAHRRLRSVATGVGRIWSRSAAIGFDSRSDGTAPPNRAALSWSMNEKVTHSSSPAAARVRRASAARTCRGVSVAAGTAASAGSDTGGMLSSPRSRSTSSTRSASGSAIATAAFRTASRSAGIVRLGSSTIGAATSLRQDGTATVTAGRPRV